MIIKKLGLENFGLFAGQQEIDLSPQKDKKIILIGGKNGNGKTTFFEAIKLCLYGQRSLDNRFSREEYEKYLIEKIHHNPELKEQPYSAGLSMEFQHTNLGRVDNYYLRRYWENNGKGLQEHFVVKRNGSDLDEVDSVQWQDFINDMIPPGLSQLFFFDGEKIQILAEDTKDNKQLADSFKSLLGVDLVEKLKSDLEIYALKQLKKENAKDLKDKIGALENETIDFQEKLDGLRQERAQLQTKIDKLNADIERQEHLIMREGGIFSEKRSGLKEENKVIDAEIVLIENQLRDFCADILPFIFARELSLKLKKSLISERMQRNDLIVRSKMQAKIKRLNTELRRKEFWGNAKLDDHDISKIAGKIISIIGENSSTQKLGMKSIHNLSDAEHTKLLSFIEESTTEAPKRLYELCKRNEELARKRLNIERELNFVPIEGALSDHLINNNSLHSQLGAIQEQIRIKDEEIEATNSSYEKVQRAQRKLIDELHTKNDLSGRLKLISKVQFALQSYHARLEQQKIKEFSDEFIKSYNQIARKKSIFERIEVDTQDYSITLYKAGGKAVPKSQLSAGEKQIYAIAVLWTLTKISGRPIPFIIDTPLGRLDSDHRHKLVHNFFPESSHQLIILSTDTEIDKQFLSVLRPHTVRTFNLEYKDGETKIVNGYFWE